MTICRPKHYKIMKFSNQAFNRDVLKHNFQCLQKSKFFIKAQSCKTLIQYFELLPVFSFSVLALVPLEFKYLFTILFLLQKYVISHLVLILQLLFLNISAAMALRTVVNKQIFVVFVMVVTLPAQIVMEMSN